jgi:hypothetical protein
LIPEVAVLKKYVLLLISSLGFFTANVFGQTATVKGSVFTSGSGIPARFLNVVVREKPSFFTTVDSLGKFELTLPANEKLTLFFPGGKIYNDTSIVVFLAEGEVKTLNIAVAYAGDLKVVNVTNWGNTGYDLNPKPISFIPGGGDISQLLKGQIGATSNNELSTGYNVRGGNFDENLVYVNDIEVYRPFLARTGGSEGLSFANADMVKSLTFAPGGFEAKYGDKMSSVLDVTYKRPKEFAATAFASLLGTNITLEGRTKNGLLGWMMGARYKTNQYLLKTLDVQGDYRPKFFDYQVFLDFKFSESFQLEYLGSLAINDYEVVPESRETRFGTINEAYSFKVYFDGKEQSKFQTLFNAVSGTYRPLRGEKRDSLRLKFIVSAYATSEKEHFTVMGQYYIDQLETDFGDPDFGNVAFNRGIGTFINH